MISELTARLSLGRRERVFDDPYWDRALQSALRAAECADYVLVPAEFLPLHPHFAPLEYSWGLDSNMRLAWCCSKDDIDRLAPWLHSTAGELRHCMWANEVFVLGCTFESTEEPDALTRRHFVAWQENLERYRSGIPARASRERRVVAKSAETSGPAGGPRVLVVGASDMGNVGDDLLADVLAGMLENHGASVYLSGPDIDPLRIRDYDLVIVGGGGLIYASRDGTNETQNLANYLKFGPIGAHFGVPTAMLGVGDQDHAGMIEADVLSHAFATRSLAQFDQIATRDAESRALLCRLGVERADSASDLLFAWTERARCAVKPSVTVPGRIAIAGQAYEHLFLTKLITSRDSQLAERLRDGDFDVLIMSNDDVEHARRLQTELKSAGASASVVDLRGRDFETLVFLFASYRAVITTRFHGFVLATLAGVPALGVDSPEGKIARLLRETGTETTSLITAAGADTVFRLSAALRGELPALPAAAVDRMAAQSAIHEQTLERLLSRLGARETRPARDLRQPRSYTLPATRTDRSASAADVPGDFIDENGAVRLCWAASSIETAGYGNLGDSLSAVVIAALANRRVRHESFDARATKLVAVGSIGHAIRHGRAVFWGTGVSIRGGILAQNFRHTDYDVRALRGVISAQHFRDFGIRVPNVFGDPVWLLPSIYNEPVEKRYELGIVPHIQDVDWHHPDAPTRADSLRCRVDDADANDVVVINTWHEPTWEGLLKKINLIRSCRRILSQSFHGLVIAEAYGIPCLNFRHLPGAENGVTRVDMNVECSTDPRVWEFYKCGERPWFDMYSQRRNERTNFAAAIDAIDRHWAPFEFDAAPLVESFPLPLGFDPLAGGMCSLEHVETLTF